MPPAAPPHGVGVLPNPDTPPAGPAPLAGTAAAARIHLVGIESGLDRGTFARLTVPGSESGNPVTPGVVQSFGSIVAGLAQAAGGAGSFAHMIRAEGPGTYCRGN